MAEATARNRGSDTLVGAADLFVRSPFHALALLAMAGASLALLASPWYKLAFLPAVGLSAFLLLHRFPTLGYYAIVFLIPFGGFRKIEGPVALNLPWLLAFVLLLVLVIHFLPGKSLPAGLRSGLWPWLFTWFAVSLVSAALSKYPGTAFSNVALLAAGYLFLALGMVLLDADALRQWLPLTLVASISLSSLLAVAGYFLNVPFLAEKHGDILVRGIGGSIDPNNMALMCLFVLPLLSHYAVWSTGGERLLCIGLGVVNVLGILTTYSRGGAAMLVLTIGLLLLSHRRLLTPRNVGVMLSLCMLGVVAALLLIPESYWARQSSVFDWQDTALSRRSSYLVVGRDAALENPVLGAGPGTFRDLYAQSEESIRYAKTSATRRRFAHNTYLEALVGTGLLGLFLFLGALTRAWRDFGRALAGILAGGDEVTASLVRSYRIMFLVVAVYLLVFSDLYHKYLLLSIALSQVSLRLAPSEEPRSI